MAIFFYCFFHVIISLREPICAGQRSGLRAPPHLTSPRQIQCPLHFPAHSAYSHRHKVYFGSFYSDSYTVWCTLKVFRRFSSIFLVIKFISACFKQFYALCCVCKSGRVIFAGECCRAWRVALNGNNTRAHLSFCSLFTRNTGLGMWVNNLHSLRTCELLEP